MICSNYLEQICTGRQAPTPGLDIFDFQAYHKTSEQDRDLLYITYVFFDMKHDAIGKNAMHELRTNWNAQGKLQLPTNDDTLILVLRRWPNTAFSKLGLE